jgi:prepilin-type N-terminal cleavage/methylation domain-containing protein
LGNQTGGNQVQLKNLLRIQEGFTLIELLAVMAIVATLAGIVATQVSGTGDTSKDVQTKQDATTVGTAVADYFSDQEGAAITPPQA